MEAALVAVLQGRLHSMGAHRIYAIRLCREVAPVLRLHAGRHPTEVRIADEQHQAQRRDDPLVAGGWKKWTRGSRRGPGKVPQRRAGAALTGEQASPEPSAGPLGTQPAGRNATFSQASHVMSMAT